MNNYLFATDGSEGSEKALDALIQRAHEDDHVLVIHVIPDVQAASILEEEYDPVTIEKQLRESSQNLLKETVQLLKNEGISAESKILTGNPGEEIVALAESESFDEIVMGRQGKGAVSELLVGSVSYYVTHHTETPILIIPGD